MDAGNGPIKDAVFRYLMSGMVVGFELPLFRHRNVVDGLKRGRLRGVRSFAAERFREMLRSAFSAATAVAWLPAETLTLLYLLLSPNWVRLKPRARRKEPEGTEPVRHFFKNLAIRADTMQKVLGVQFFQRDFMRSMSEKLQVSFAEVRSALEHLLWNARIMESEHIRWRRRIHRFYRHISPYEKRLLVRGQTEDLLLLTRRRRKRFEEVADFSSHVKLVRRKQHRIQ